MFFLKKRQKDRVFLWKNPGKGGVTVPTPNKNMLFENFRKRPSSQNFRCHNLKKKWAIFWTFLKIFKILPFGWFLPVMLKYTHIHMRYKKGCKHICGPPKFESHIFCAFFRVKNKKTRNLMEKTCCRAQKIFPRRLRRRKNSFFFQDPRWHFFCSFQKNMFFFDCQDCFWIS